MATSLDNVREPIVATPEARQAFEETALKTLEKFGAVRSEKNSWELMVEVCRCKLHATVQAIRDELGLDMLLDIVGIDYLGFKDYAGPRFAVEYVFKSVYEPAKRMMVKVLVEEADAKIPTISDLYGIANWQEREVYDQYGIVFEGHPDLRRILNHVEFVGRFARITRHTVASGSPRTITCIRRLKSVSKQKAIAFSNVRSKSIRQMKNICKGVFKNESLDS